MIWLFVESTIMWLLILGFGIYSLCNWKGIKKKVEPEVPVPSLNESQVSFERADPAVLLEMIKQFTLRLALVLVFSTVQFAISLL